MPTQSLLRAWCRFASWRKATRCSTPQTSGWRVLFYLALAIDKQDPEFARSLRDTRADLTSRWRERELDERARAAVLEAADALGKRLVLMVENLQALCANVDADFGWKLRKTLQTEPQIILIATATSRFEELHDAREPFFELFRIICLAPLDTAQCRRLWEVASGDAASEREIRPLEILTGGSPRFLVIVAEFARHRSLRRLMEELVQLIDDLTDTFRGDLQALPKTERRIFLAIADLWRPSTTGEIATRARMDVRTVSTMLGRLVERGAVLRSGTGRKRLYDAAERLYSIYYKLRRERDDAAVVQGLLRFMAGFYTWSEKAGRPALPVMPVCRLLSSFCSLYAAFLPDDEAMVAELVDAVAMLVAAGVPEREIIAILRCEPRKETVVAPLIMALRQRDGETVRAPAEVLEVAADVRQRIDETGMSLPTTSDEPVSESKT